MSTKQNVLIIGSGGREHALAWKIAQSPKLGRLFVAPGNSGTAGLATNIDVPASDIPGLVSFAQKHGIDVTVVGPDDALAAGVVDAFLEAGLRIFGPTRTAARIESSKAFSKDLMTKQAIPTARYATFHDLKEAKEYAASQTYPLVVKASGLALGKGVVICANVTEANAALEDMLASGKFGQAGQSVVIEEYLAGEEVSAHAFCDGVTAVMFPAAQDHKQIYTGDRGPNTGGMGTYAPVPWVAPALMQDVQQNAVEPALAGLAADSAPFRGVLYPGLMVGEHDMNVLEFNARFGDPETQSYMRLLETDLLDIIDACIGGTLASTEVRWADSTAITVVLAAAGYPEKAMTGVPISGLDEAAVDPDVVIFHAGTKLENGQHITSGGRVLGVSAVGRDVMEARQKAYAAIKHIHFEGMQYRTDIGARPHGGGN